MPAGSAADFVRGSGLTEKRGVFPVFCFNTRAACVHILGRDIVKHKTAVVVDLRHIVTRAFHKVADYAVSLLAKIPRHNKIKILG